MLLAGALGTFYEGVMTAGFSSDETDMKVHANIAAANYQLAATSAMPAPIYGEIFASVRKDVWLAEFMVEEQPAPVSGRRVQIVARRASSTEGMSDADLHTVTINGVECLNLASDADADLSVFDWCRAHVSAQDLWISYHTRNASFSENRTLEVKAIAGTGVVISGAVEAAVPSLVLSYVTTAGGGRKAIIHVHSASKVPLAVARLLFDGAEVPVAPTQGSVAESLMIPPNGHAVFVAELPQPKSHGDVWTAVLFTGGGAPGAAWGGRVGPERFPIETWPHTPDCPLPKGRNATANSTELRDLGIDSVFQGFGRYKGNCDPSKDPSAKTYSAVLDDLVEEGWWHVFLDGEGADQWTKNAMLSTQTRAKVVDAILTGDEVDGGITATHLRRSLNLSLENVRSTPDLMVYQGAATNAFVGAFSGITDIQGMDAYAAACAPTQLATMKRLPLSYPYSYLRNTRDNHMPNTFWGYSQLVGSPDGSSSEVGSSTGWDYEPAQNELVAQVRTTSAMRTRGLQGTDYNAMRAGCRSRKRSCRARRG